MADTDIVQCPHWHTVEASKRAMPGLSLQLWKKQQPALSHLGVLPGCALSTGCALTTAPAETSNCMASVRLAAAA